MRILVTGHNGFLGRVLFQALQGSGHELIGLSRRSGQLRHDLSNGSPPLASEAPDLDLVVHAAGLAHGHYTEKAHFQSHVGGTRNLLDALPSQAPPNLVFISTVAVYGTHQGENLDESTPTRAEGGYGKAKLAAESICRTWGEETGARVTILRLPLIAGPNPPGNLGAMVRGLKTRRYLRPGSGRCRRSIVLASDVASCLLTAPRVAGTFNLTDGHHPSLIELERGLCAAMEAKEPRSLPTALLLPAAAAGSLVERLGLRVPITLHKLRKLTSTLTFSDQLARDSFGWSPRRVIDTLSEVV